MPQKRTLKFGPVASVSAQFLRLSTSLILTLFVDPEAFGLFTLAFLVFGVFNLFRYLGTTTAIVHASETSAVQQNSVFLINCCTGLVLGLIALLISAPYSEYFGEADLQLIIVSLSLPLIIGSAAGVPFAILQKRLDYAALGTADLFGGITYMAVGVGTAACGLGYWALVLSAAIAEVVFTLCVFVQSRFRPRLQFSLSSVRPLLSYSGPLLLHNLSTYVLSNLDRFLVGKLLGSAELGLYSVAHRVIGFLVTFVLPRVYDLFLPYLVKLRDRGQTSKGLLDCLVATTLLAYPVIVGISLITPLAVEHILGSEWAPIVSLVPILAGRYLLEMIVKNSTFTFMVVGRTDLLLRWGLFSGIFISFFVLIGSNWGLMGVAVGQLVAFALLIVPCQFLLFREIDMSVRCWFKAIVATSMYTVAMGIAVYLFGQFMQLVGFHPIATLMAMVIIGVLVYILALNLVPPPLSAAFAQEILKQDHRESAS